MWRPFYEAFRNYEYVLIYHLDSLVFSDRLAEWCQAGWDYIGAPWLPCADTPWVTAPHVGNGGFTLMKVDTVRRVLYERHKQKPETYWADIVTRNDAALAPLFHVLEWATVRWPRWRTVSRAASYWRAVRTPSEHGCNNDAFWSYEAVRYLPSFKVAPVREGLKFAFEASPRTCFEMNSRQLPFGCHAWWKFDAEFWRPYLLADTTAA
jgi:hypothetical protein